MQKCTGTHAPALTSPTLLKLWGSEDLKRPICAAYWSVKSWSAVCRREPNLIPDCTMFLHWLPVYGNCIIGSLVPVYVCVFVCGIYASPPPTGLTSEWTQVETEPWESARLFQFAPWTLQVSTCSSLVLCGYTCRLSKSTVSLTSVGLLRITLDKVKRTKNTV